MRLVALTAPGHELPERSSGVRHQTSAAVILQELRDLSLSHALFERAVTMSARFWGEQHVKTAIAYVPSQRRPRRRTSEGRRR